MRHFMRKAAIAAVMAVAVSGQAAADQKPSLFQVAAMGADAGRAARAVELPDVLTPEEVRLYKSLFDRHERADWPTAMREVTPLQNDLLKGHLQAMRLLGPGWRSSGNELAEWLQAYADHPNADRIYRLAQQRVAKNVTLPRPANEQGEAPRIVKVGSNTGADWEGFGYSRPKASGSERAQIRDWQRQARRLVGRGQNDEALALLDNAKLRKALNPIEQDEIRALVAAGYFAAGEDDKAIKVATAAAERSGAYLPWAHWTAGLALWRQDRREDSLPHFEAVARAEGSPWMQSAGAFWAARAALVSRRPQVVTDWLQKSAANPRTFYGQIARRALALDSDLAWAQSVVTQADVDNLLRSPGAKRALALAQIGRMDMAELELRLLVPNADPALAASALALAKKLGMSSLASQLAHAVANRDEKWRDDANYPIPDFTPSDGWKIDRALVLAIARQESGFDPNAVSPAGATGLMQLMPATARYIAGGSVNGARLKDPSYNLSLGQKYIQYLFDDQTIGGNILLMVAAYNSGPGNLQKWEERLSYKEDPLLFVESIPSRETRIFIERVMTSFWIYRSRLGQPAKSLTDLASGDWPIYDPMDAERRAAAEQKKKVELAHVAD